MDIAILPLAITMMAGPQILSAIVFVSGRSPVRTSGAFVAAVGLATAGAVLVWTVLAGIVGDEVRLSRSSQPTTAGKLIPVALVALLIALSVKAFRGRKTAEPPKWLGRLQSAGPRQAFGIGLLLILVFPSDVLITMTIGVRLRSVGRSLLAALPFVAATAGIAALPLLLYVLFRRRAEITMPRVRDWMTANAWLVTIAVNLLFIVLILT